MATGKSDGSAGVGTRGQGIRPGKGRHRGGGRRGIQVPLAATEGYAMATQRIVIVDDHPLFRGALSQALTSAIAGAEILEAGSLDELGATLDARKDIDLVLLDLSMPGVQGLSGLLFLRAQHPEIPVVIVSASDDPGTIRHALEFGASGFVPKTLPVEQIRNAIRLVLEGQLWTPPGIPLEGAADPRGDGVVAAF